MLNTPANPYHHQTHRQSENKDTFHEIPFWIGNEQRRVLVSGIKKMTTCQDVIRNLLPSFSQQDPTKTTFFLVEKWRKIERKLEPNELIHQVWKGWGDEKKEVHFILKESTLHQHPSSSATANSPPALSVENGLIHHKVHHRKHKKQNRKSSQQQPRESSFQDESLSRGVKSLEGLLLLVLKQRETIQTQLKKLRHKEERIEKYEEEVHHLNRVQDGTDYMLDAYLEKRKCHNRSSTSAPRVENTAAECSSTSFPSEAVGHRVRTSVDPETNSNQRSLPGELPCLAECKCEGTLGNSLISLRLEAELILKICVLNKKLKKEEGRLGKLGDKIQGLAMSGPLPGEGGSFEEVLTELTTIREITDEQSGEIQKNEESLSELDFVLQIKQERLAQLAQDLQSADFQSQILQKQIKDLNEPKDFEKSAPQPLFHSTPLPPEGARGKFEFKLQKDLEPEGGIMTAEAYSSSPESILNLHEKELCNGEDNNDSNSDTGISSLHSSRDENSPLLLPLDTLV